MTDQDRMEDSARTADYYLGQALESLAKRGLEPTPELIAVFMTVAAYDFRTCSNTGSVEQFGCE